MDLICPIYWVNEACFEFNLKSWIKELPINRILLGINNLKQMDYCRKLAKKYPQVIIISQLHFKTLGKCLADLMQQIETEWFVYIHGDVKITPYAFKIMREYMKPNVGIIESERLYWTGKVSNRNGHEIPIYAYKNYYNMNRAYSGFQIFQKKAIEPLIDRIEDDYIYQNESIIFQYECMNNDFDYTKTLALHIHQPINKLTLYDEEVITMFQWRGLVKYSQPTEISILPCILAIHKLKANKDFSKKIGFTIDSVLAFCFGNDSNWAMHIAEWWKKDLKSLIGDDDEK